MDIGWGVSGFDVAKTQKNKIIRSGHSKKTQLYLRYALRIQIQTPFNQLIFSRNSEITTLRLERDEKCEDNTNQINLNTDKGKLRLAFLRNNKSNLLKEKILFFN